MSYGLYETFFKRRKSSPYENPQKENIKVALFRAKLIKPAKMRQKICRFYGTSVGFRNFYPPLPPIPLNQRVACERRAQARLARGRGASPPGRRSS